MKILVFSTLGAILAAAVPAKAQETVPYGAIQYDILPKDAAETYGIPLAEGEEVIGIYAVPSIIQIPGEQGGIRESDPYLPSTEIDRVTGLPRNTPGWTGDAAAPAAIGCFPQGVCIHLND